MILNYILTPIFIIIILIYLNKILKSNNSIKIPKSNKNSNPILSIYQMLYDIDYIFKKNKIIYYIDGGTLLGAVRHKGIIPWDDDGDICIFKSDEYKLLNLKSQLNKLGYNIVKYWGGYKICLINGKRIQIENTNWKWNNKVKNNKRNNIKYTFPFIDISIVEETNNEIIYYNNTVKKIWNKCKHNKNHLFPLKKYRFGLIFLYGPNDPTNYLNRCYGKEWRLIKKENYDHLNQRFIKKTALKMNKNDYLPALPLGPIITRFY